jgi:hypothetical protein
MDDEDGEEEDDEFIILPVLKNVKRLYAHAFEYDTGQVYLHQILQVPISSLFF